MSSRKSYSELCKIEGYEDRFEYLKLKGSVGESTFGYDRYLNQHLYKSKKWLKVRNQVIIRDDACDLGDKDHKIWDKVIVHHMNPLTLEDIESGSDCIFDMDGLICVSQRTHNAIHYGDSDLLPKDPIVRTSGDTCPWLRRGGNDG